MKKLFKKIPVVILYCCVGLALAIVASLLMFCATKQTDYVMLAIVFAWALVGIILTAIA